MALPLLNPVDFPVDRIFKCLLFEVFESFEEIKSVKIRDSGMNEVSMQLFEESLEFGIVSKNKTTSTWPFQMLTNHSQPLTFDLQRSYRNSELEDIDF